MSNQIKVVIDQNNTHKPCTLRHMQYWDVSQVTSMSEVFSQVFSNVNKCDIPDISGWDVSQVTDFVSNPLTRKELNLI